MLTPLRELAREHMNRLLADASRLRVKPSRTQPTQETR
jgi:hypothetical protein